MFELIYDCTLMVTSVLCPYFYLFVTDVFFCSVSIKIGILTSNCNQRLHKKHLITIIISIYIMKHSFIFSKSPSFYRLFLHDVIKKTKASEKEKKRCVTLNCKMPNIGNFTGICKIISQNTIQNNSKYNIRFLVA